MKNNVHASTEAHVQPITNTKEINEMSNEYASNGISITNQCYNCMQLDSKCDECQDLADARSAEIAHDLVDEGNLQYRNPWSWMKDMPSGHDWTDRDGEFKLPVVMLQDGGVLDNAWELDDYAQSQRETKCPWCNLFTPKVFNDCQDCDRPLEGNVR
jgi:hypothetical protein